MVKSADVRYFQYLPDWLDVLRAATLTFVVVHVSGCIEREIKH